MGNLGRYVEGIGYQVRPNVYYLHFWRWWFGEGTENEREEMTRSKKWRYVSIIVHTSIHLTRYSSDSSNENDDILPLSSEWILITSFGHLQDDDGILTISIGEYAKLGSKGMQLTRNQTRRNKYWLAQAFKWVTTTCQWRSALSGSYTPITFSIAPCCRTWSDSTHLTHLRCLAHQWPIIWGSWKESSLEVTLDRLHCGPQSINRAIMQTSQFRHITT